MKELSIADLYAINILATNSLNSPHHRLEDFNYWKQIQVNSHIELTERLKQYHESITK